MGDVRLFVYMGGRLGLVRVIKGYQGILVIRFERNSYSYLSKDGIFLVHRCSILHHFSFRNFLEILI